jgi:enoyl-CoA hydratase/carnithine racemase
LIQGFRGLRRDSTPHELQAILGVDLEQHHTIAVADAPHFVMNKPFIASHTHKNKPSARQGSVSDHIRDLKFFSGIDLIAALLRKVQSAAREGKRALVLSGSPGMFSAGLDVPILLKLDRRAMDAVWREFYGLMNALASSPIPIAAAITGHAPAGGTVLALFCDWRVVAEGDFKIGLSEVRAGLPLPPLILSALRRLVGARQAERLAVTGPLVSPRNATLGLVDEVVPPNQVVERALKWCQDLLALSHVATDLTRRQAPADLVGEFAGDIDHELAQVSSWWWNQQTQGALHQMVEQLAMKKKS